MSMDRIRMSGRYHLEHRRGGVLLATRDFDNLVTTLGKNWALDRIFALAGVESPHLQMGLINATPAPSISADDTYNTHAGWVVFPSASAVTVVVTDSASSRRLATDGVEFAITGDGSISGGYIFTGQSLLLFSAGKFTGAEDIEVVSGDTVTVTYTLMIA